PTVVGLKVTLMVQSAPGATSAVQPLTAENDGPPVTGSTAIELTVSGAFPMLLTVMTVGAEFVPMSWPAKVIVAGETRMTGAAGTGSGWPAATAAAIASATEKVSNALHFLVTGSLPVQKRSCSMFQSVSMPSPLANRPPSATEALSATVTLWVTGSRVIV